MNAAQELSRVAQARALVAPFASEYPFQSHFLDLDGVGYHFVDEGPREAEPILFVHGNPTWSFHWRALVGAFRGERRCVAPDHVGCGLSDKPSRYAYRLETHVANLERLVLELDLSRITLAVHDWGGPIGFGFALRQLERVARLVVFNSAVFPLDFEGGRAPWRIRACRTPLFGELAVRGFNAFSRGATAMAVEDRAALGESARRGYLAPYDSFAHRIGPLRFVQDIPLSPRDPSWPALRAIERDLPRLQHLPLCLIWGERDWCFTPAFRREWQRRFPRARVHVAERAGHWVVEDARDDTVRWMREFLADHPLGP